jgi:hypothetical protein
LRRFENLNRSARNTSLDLHRQTLLRFSMDSLSIRSDDTCFPCLQRRPQYNLPCGHCVCENCVRSFGMRNQYNPWLFEVDSCFFCSLTTCGVTVKTRPPTAGIRVLTLDGGGVRGLTTLEFLRHLQYKIDLPYPVQENFDVAFGTSSGEAYSPEVSLVLISNQAGSLFWHCSSTDGRLSNVSSASNSLLKLLFNVVHHLAYQSYLRFWTS